MESDKLIEAMVQAMAQIEYPAMSYEELATAALKALRDTLEPVVWQPIETAPKDGRYILAQVAPVQDGPLRYQTCRVFSIRHEGQTNGGYDMGWAVYPGFGGVDDNSFSGWMPIPTGTLFALPEVKP